MTEQDFLDTLIGKVIANIDADNYTVTFTDGTTYDFDYIESQALINGKSREVTPQELAEAAESHARIMARPSDPSRFANQPYRPSRRMEPDTGDRVSALKVNE